MPFIPGFFSDVGVHQELFPAIAHDPRHPGEPGRVPVLPVYFQPVLFTNFVQVVHPPLVLFKSSSLHLYNGMQALPSGIYQARYRQFQPAHYSILFFQVDIVRLDKRMPVACNILVLDIFSIQRIKPNPRPCFLVIVAYCIP